MTIAGYGPPPAGCGTVTIPGRRVVLRPVDASEYALIAAWQNQPDVWRLMDYDRTFSVEDIAASEAQAALEGCPFVIELDGRPIGRIGLNRFRPRDRVCSVYVYIGEPENWGLGFGRDAIGALLGHAFVYWDVDLVELWTLADNERAVRAYRACGFRTDGRLRARSLKDGKRHDHVIMSVTREEFAASQQGAKMATDRRTDDQIAS